ncbi:hypothetical protein LC612_31085 [Nostoc sp. CHAB 5834]|nr:hypothetical protein [Nostoc sp. CHAB 5834]
MPKVVKEQDKLSASFHFRLKADEAVKVREIAAREGKPPTEVIREYFLKSFESVSQ